MKVLPDATVLPGDWSNLVVVCGAVRWSGSRMVDQHLALGLRRYAPVLYIDLQRPWRPGSPGSESKRPGTLDVELVEPGLALATPHVLPGHQRRGMKAVSLALVRDTIRRAVRALGSPPVEAVVVPSLNPLFGVCDEKTKVFYLTDDFVAGADLLQLSARRLERAMDRITREADLIVAASPALERLLVDKGYDSLLMPNGCDPEAFATVDDTPPAADVTLPGPIAGFVGHLSHRIDARYLAGIADRGLSLLLVGPGPRAGLGEELQAVVDRDDVQWVGPRSFDELPSYLRHIDVGLVPYADTSFNHASFPLKALEYLAAGRPVLSTDIAAMRWLRDGEHIGATPPPPLAADDLVVRSGAGAYADEASRLLEQVAQPIDRERRRTFARSHSWERRIDVLASALDLRPTRVPSSAGSRSSTGTEGNPS